MNIDKSKTNFIIDLLKYNNCLGKKIIKQNNKINELNKKILELDIVRDESQIAINNLELTTSKLVKENNDLKLKISTLEKQLISNGKFSLETIHKYSEDNRKLFEENGRLKFDLLQINNKL